MTRKRKPKADDLGHTLASAINAARDWRSTPFGAAALKAGATSLAEAAVLAFMAARKRETGNETVLMGDAGVAREAGLSETAGRAAIVALMERGILRPATGLFLEDGIAVTGMYQGRVDAMRFVDLPPDAPVRPRASMSL